MAAESRRSPGRGMGSPSRGFLDHDGHLDRRGAELRRCGTPEPIAGGEHEVRVEDDLTAMELKNSIRANASLTVQAITLFESRREKGEMVYIPLHREKI